MTTMTKPQTNRAERKRAHAREKRAQELADRFDNAIMQWRKHRTPNTHASMLAAQEKYYGHLRGSEAAWPGGR